MDTELILSRIIHKVEFAQVLLACDKLSNLDSK